jgi:hypothetical protein
MPENTNRKAALRKSNPLPEMKTVGPTRRVRQVVTYDHPPVRAALLPEASYIHKARAAPAPPSKSQLQAIALFKQGMGLREIAQSTGLPIERLVNTLKPEGLSEETHKEELESLNLYYTTRRNP